MACMGTFFSIDIWLMIFGSITCKQEGERVTAELILSNNSSLGVSHSQWEESRHRRESRHQVQESLITEITHG